MHGHFVRSILKVKFIISTPGYFCPFLPAVYITQCQTSNPSFAGSLKIFSGTKLWQRFFSSLPPCLSVGRAWVQPGVRVPSWLCLPGCALKGEDPVILDAFFLPLIEWGSGGNRSLGYLCYIDSSLCGRPLMKRLFAFSIDNVTNSLIKISFKKELQGISIQPNMLHPPMLLLYLGKRQWSVKDASTSVNSSTCALLVSNICFSVQWSVFCIL